MQVARIAGLGWASLALMASLALPASAEVPIETATLGEFSVTLHVQPFLTEEDLILLRLVQSSQEALELFVPQAGGFAAMAASPDDGFVKDGIPAASAVALGGLPDAATAAANAIEGCQKAKTGAADCVLILEIAPK